MQQIQLTAKLSFLGAIRSPGDILSVLPEKAQELIEAKKAIAYPPEKPPEKVEAKKVKEPSVQGN